MTTAKIITIGDEILIGQIIDTNSAWMANELTQIGIKVSGIESIPDSASDIYQAIDNNIAKHDILIFTGGLGPTKDDITKKSLADYFNSPLILNEQVHQDVKDFLSYRGSKLNGLNNQQALVPQKAKILRNRQGTAPGMWFQSDGKVVISIPGVPSEMRGLMEQEVLPKLKESYKLSHIEYFTVLTTGMAEAHLAERLNTWEQQLPENMSLAYLPSPGIVRLRLGMAGDHGVTLKKCIQEQIEGLKKIVGHAIFGYNKDTLQLIVGKLLKNNNKTISIAESCTGGNISHLLTTVPGSSAYFVGGVVAYQNEVKQQLLNVQAESLKTYGAVSEKVVEEMALGACQRFGTDYSVATSGIAGPDGGTEQKPVGTVWIAVCGPMGVKSKKLQLGKEREINIRRSSIAALNLLRKQIILDNA